jgi:maltose O-acetyltransferase
MNTVQPQSQEWERMLAGELYDPADPLLVEARIRSQRLCRQYNVIDFEHLAARTALLVELFGSFGEKSEIVAPFYCDYGCHIRAGTGVFMNFGCVILDCSWITIGDRVLMGPCVQIYAATHPLEASMRATLKELARPVTIHNDVWIGGGAILCPGVTVGAGTTIGAGSVVTRDIPANVFAAGNPCRVIRELGGAEIHPQSG